jgi:hypothetical protein
MLKRRDEKICPPGGVFLYVRQFSNFELLNQIDYLGVYNLVERHIWGLENIFPEFLWSIKIRNKKIFSDFPIFP